MTTTDLIIIGGGPAGYHAAQLAAKAGLSVLLFEKRAVGGVCLNEGCIPTKALLYSAKLYDFAKGGAAPYGVTCDNPVLDYAAAVRRKDKVVKKLTAGIEAALKQAGVEIVREHAVITGRDENGFFAAANNSQRRGRRILICTGSEPILPRIKGIENAMTSREILSLDSVPETLTVIGGGVSGLEFASLFNSAGSKVTVYEMLDKIAGPFDREISEALQKIYEKKGIEFRLGTKLEEVSGPALVSSGRRAVTAGLEDIGLYMENGAVVTDEQMKTNIPGVYAAGDVTGKWMLAHVAYREAEAAVNNILGKPDRMDYSAIPSVIYTNPEAASIGETMETARAKGYNARETKLPMMYSGRFMAENERGEAAAPPGGMCKLVWNGDRLIGAHLLGNPASEVIAAFPAILYREMSLEQIKKLIFPHPSAAEIIHEAVHHA
jgi:dihydrolipoamide dehydrogenase